MTPNLEIINAQVPGYRGLQQLKIDEQGRIIAILPMTKASRDLPSIDVAGDWLSLGGVDLQINGGLGLAFTDVNKQHVRQIEKICQFLWHQGIDAFLPTLVTTSVEKTLLSLSVFADFMASQNHNQERARIEGVHLEGPFLNPDKRGAHPTEYLLPLEIENVKRVLGDYADIVKVITLAPELDSTGEVIPYLRSLDITVSLGHSLATSAQAEQAFEEGASLVTHAFNAMPGLHHREPGLLGAALAHSHVYCGVIADGQHVCPIMLQLLLRAGCYEKGLFLVSDALAPLGLPDGVYPWDKRQIEVKKGTARLADGTLSGTTLPLLVAVENLVRWDICGIESAIAMATIVPRQVIGLPTIEVGQSTNLLRWHLDQVSNKLTWERFLEDRKS